MGGRRISIVDDHGLIAHTVAAALSHDGTTVDVVDLTADDLVRSVLAGDPDLALVDLDLAERGSGLDLVAPIAAAGVPVVVLTGVTDRVRRARCIAAGAVGVLSKAGSFDDLVAGIERAVRDGSLLTAHEREEHLRLLRAHEDAEQRRLAPFAALTPREADVLAELMRGRSVEQIALAQVVSVTTVRSHVRGVLTKLGVGTQLAATAAARRAGWGPGAPDA